jgi:hypothetical protein
MTWILLNQAQHVRFAGGKSDYMSRFKLESTCCIVLLASRLA